MFFTAEKAQCEKCMTYNENIIFYPKDATGTNTIGLCARCEMKNEDGTACICPNGQFWVFADGNHSFCRECTNQSGYVSTKIECDKCPNRYYATTNNDRSGSCQLCPTGKVKSSDGRSCVDVPAE